MQTFPFFLSSISVDSAKEPLVAQIAFHDTLRTRGDVQIATNFPHYYLFGREKTPFEGTPPVMKGQGCGPLNKYLLLARAEYIHQTVEFPIITEAVTYMCRNFKW